MIEIHGPLGIERNLTTKYHFHTSGQEERFNEALLEILSKYVRDFSHDWDLYTRELTFPYKMHVLTTIGAPQFELALSHTLPKRRLETESSATH